MLKDKKFLNLIEEDFEEIIVTEEDIIRVAKKLGCPSSDITSCKQFLQELYYKKYPENYKLN